MSAPLTFKNRKISTGKVKLFMSALSRGTQQAQLARAYSENLARSDRKPNQSTENKYTKLARGPAKVVAQSWMLESDLLRSNFSSYRGDLQQLNLFMPQSSLLKKLHNYPTALGYRED